MAVNDPTWLEGKVETFQSTGETPTVCWFEGEVLVVHEYAETGVEGNPWYYYAQQQ